VHVAKDSLCLGRVLGVDVIADLGLKPIFPSNPKGQKPAK
jgi:hypothetical protein